MHAIVIDDSRTMRRILRRILEDIGFEVVEASDGRAALDLLADADRAPDLALVDWNMPEMDGLAFVVEARKRPATRSMTLMMVTTEGEHGQIVRALASGAHEYVIKPFTSDGIRDKLALLGLLPAEVQA